MAASLVARCCSPAFGGVADQVSMSGTEVILTLVVIAVLLVGLQAALGFLVHWRRRKAAAGIVGRNCPNCGRVFDRSVTWSARWEAGVFLTCRHVSVICPGCLTRWMYVEGAFIEIPQ